MSDCCNCSCKGETVLTRYPEKTELLVKFLDSLEIGAINENRGYLINCLHKAQTIFGYLPLEIQTLIAEKLKLNVSDVYGVISFYSFFTTQPPGRNKISVCLGTACFVKGADKILSEFETQTGIKDGETSKDLKYSLGGLRCVGACSLAPVVIVNDKVYSKFNTKMVKKVLSSCE